MARNRKKENGNGAPVTTAQALGSLLKSARDIMRKDKGLNGDLDRLHVRFTLESGHVRCNGLCLLWANSGHRAYHFIRLIGAETASIRFNREAATSQKIPAAYCKLRN